MTIFFLGAGTPLALWTMNGNGPVALLWTKFMLLWGCFRFTVFTTRGGKAANLLRITEARRTTNFLKKALMLDYAQVQGLPTRSRLRTVRRDVNLYLFAQADNASELLLNWHYLISGDSKPGDGPSLATVDTLVERIGTIMALRMRDDLAKGGNVRLTKRYRD